MPWCPKCGKEYPPEETDCEDCNAVLESAPPQGVDLRDYADMVPVCYLENEIEGPLLQDILEESGIHSIIRSYKIPGYDLLECGTSNWGELLVLEPDLEKATKLLDEYEKGIDKDPAS